MLAKWLRDGHTTAFFSYVDKQLAYQFAEGPRGWGLYKEISTLVMENAPAQHDEFIRRYASNVDDQAVAGEFGADPDAMSKAFLKALQDEIAEKKS